MAESDFRGPINSMGSLEVQSGATATIEPMDGPSGFYQGIAFLDPRASPFNKDGTAPARQPAFMASPVVYVVDNFPQAASTAIIAATQTIATAGLALAMGLATTGVNGAASGVPSIATKVPILPQGTAVIATAALALDFGFATGTTVANSSAVVVNDSTLFKGSQWVIIGNAGAANQASFITQVQTIANATTITVLPVPPAAGSILPIGQANLYGADLLPPGTQFGPPTAQGSYHSPNMSAGFLRVHNPREMISRNVSVSLVTAGVATSAAFLVAGWDVWRQPMTELITVGATAVATTTFGKKAFKYINSVTVTANGTTNQYSVGVGDVFGFPLRADEFEQTAVFWNGNSVGTSLGFSAGTTAPANNTTGDVRGTVQASINGAGTAVAISTATVSNGTARLVLVQEPGVWNTINATPLNPVPLFGVTQA